MGTHALVSANEAADQCCDFPRRPADDPTDVTEYCSQQASGLQQHASASDCSRARRILQVGRSGVRGESRRDDVNGASRDEGEASRRRGVHGGRP